MSRAIEPKSMILRRTNDERKQAPRANEREVKLWRQFVQAWNCQPRAVGNQVYHAVKTGF